MSKLTKAQQAEREAAIAKLREVFPPGSTAHTILRHVSKSGMSRVIAVIAPDFEDVTGYVAKVLDLPMDHTRWGVKVGGAGMDMGFHVVYSMSGALYGWDNQGGYAINHRWL